MKDSVAERIETARIVIADYSFAKLLSPIFISALCLKARPVLLLHPHSNTRPKALSK
jgi:hypothetical protein